MNAGAAKKTRREMRRYFRQHGLAPEDLERRLRLQVAPCPWFFPRWLWAFLAKRFLVAGLGS